jgi:hypothetical protein
MRELADATRFTGRASPSETSMTTNHQFIIVRNS